MRHRRQANGTLSMDAVQAANSGHPDTPVAMAPVADGAADPIGLSRNRP
jgi:transketolase